MITSSVSLFCERAKLAGGLDSMEEHNFLFSANSVREKTGSDKYSTTLHSSPISQGEERKQEEEDDVAEMVEFTEKDFDASQREEELVKQKSKIKNPMIIDWVAKKNRSSDRSFKRIGGSDASGTQDAEDVVEEQYQERLHDLPEEFKREIERLGGTKVELVIEKQLTKTDISSSIDRMSMPLNQLVSISFLEDEDKEMLENCKTMTVQLIDPGLVHGDINLRRLVMGKNPIYALRTQWGDVARKNKLKAADLVQVWSFRVNRALHLALVLAKSSSVEGDHQESDGGGDSECQSSIVDGGSSNSGGSEAEQRSWKNGTGGDNYGIIKGF
ncbi:B3 domain-containing protein [Pyrus ussuriensis x Pyrus communis]|uniref:B3 domain-containing protein n=1 Tax=Pyrus ussuriensis x Pyrus communis TaxID=2448454 RepID=A0A5N5GYB8_9ROSA|nr:B3 domain-containing protein [Pyrus ussuriensis x Pyrus communis]